MEKKTHDKRVRGWFIHLLFFLIVQITFFIVDRSNWALFQLNQIGENVENRLSNHVFWVEFYDMQFFNFIAIIWGILLLIDGFLVVLSWILAKRKASHQFINTRNRR